VKKTDPNYKSWVTEYGPNQCAVELDALHPKTLKELLKIALSEVYDIDNMIDEQKKEIKERETVLSIKKDIYHLMAEKYPYIYEQLI
jgi:hypothetical protein